MSEANVVFILDGENLRVQCTTEDKMKDICKNYATKINKNINSLIFLYEGNKVNFELIFEEQANIIDRKNHEMKILVNKNENNRINNSIIISNSIKSNSNFRNVNYLKNINLLDNIKSIFFFRILFLHLNEKIKLNIIKYNKKMQNKIDIKLINYKFYSGKYIIYETKTKGKEYDGHSDDLIFEGEFLNGERNGKGKEYYYNGNIIFEGEYLNGKRNGKGKEYYYNGIIKFEGEYLNGERLNGKLYDKNGYLYCNLKNANGLIKEYNYDGNLKFEGEYINGKRHGKGKEYSIIYFFHNKW